MCRCAGFAPTAGRRSAGPDGSSIVRLDPVPISSFNIRSVKIPGGKLTSPGGTVATRHDVPLKLGSLANANLKVRQRMASVPGFRAPRYLQ